MLSVPAQQRVLDLSRRLAHFVSLPVGKRYAREANKLQPDSLVVRCVDSRLNPILSVLGLTGYDVFSIANPGPFLPPWRDWEILRRDWDSAASFELAAQLPDIKSIYVVVHGPTCKFCDAAINGVAETDETHHLCSYIRSATASLCSEHSQDMLLGSLLPGTEEQLAMGLGLVIRANMRTYPVMQHRTGVPIYVIYIGFDPLRVMLCPPDSEEYVPVPF